MNQFLQDNLIAIIVFLLLLVFVLMGAMIFMLFKMVVQPRQNAIPTPPVAPETPKRLADLPFKEKMKIFEEPIVEKHYCIHHPDAPSVGSCLICEEVFCEKCLVDHESMHFCKEHFRTFAANKWRQITDVRTTPDTPEDGLFIYKFKRDLWINKSIPTFVMTHYKINLENDFIESFIQLNVREADVEKLSSEILLYKALE